MADPNATTQPLLNEILEAINSLGVEFHDFRAEMEKRSAKLERTMNERFDDLDRRLDVLAGDVVRLRAREGRPALRRRSPLPK